MKTLLFAFSLLLLVAFCAHSFAYPNDNPLDVYKSKRCPEHRCMISILDFLWEDTNEEFISSERTQTFLSLIGETDSKPKVYVEKLFVYATLDSAKANEIVDSFTKPIDLRGDSWTGKFEAVYNHPSYKRFEQLFVYVGSGFFGRPHQHLIYSKATCPSEGQIFVHPNTNPAVMYICKSIFFPHQQEKLNYDVFVFPIMAVKNYTVALRLETALIRTLQDVLVNYMPSTTDIDHKTIHFLGHYAMEYVFRFLAQEEDNVKFNHMFTSTYPIHKMISFGHFKTYSHAPKELVYQGKAFFEYDLSDYTKVDGTIVSGLKPTVLLPFGRGGFDYTLFNNQKAQNEVIDALALFVNVAFKNILPEFITCFDKESKAILVLNTKTLKELVGRLYYALHACARNAKQTPYQVQLNDNLLRRVQSKFEYKLLFSLYVEYSRSTPTKIENAIYTDWSPIESDQLFKELNPPQAFPRNFKAQSQTVEKYFVTSELKELTKKEVDTKINEEELIMLTELKEVKERCDAKTNDEKSGGQTYEVIDLTGEGESSNAGENNNNDNMETDDECQFIRSFSR